MTQTAQGGAPQYDAFISYRHVSLDIQVALKLHKMLESFQLPGKQMQETGRRQKQFRVFMDQWELPVTSDLFATIQDALQNSSRLLLICSKETPASVWVDQEVVTFARLRGWENIIPILIEGTVETSFPKPLRDHGAERFLNISGQPDAKHIVREIDRNRGWVCAHLAGCDERTLSKSMHWRDAWRATLRTAAIVAALAVVSFYSLQLRQQALASQAVAVTMETQAKQSEEQAQEQQRIYEDGFAAVQQAQKNKQENNLWEQVAAAEAEARAYNALPAIAHAKEILAQAGDNETIKHAAHALIAKAQPTGLLSPVFVSPGTMSANFTHDGTYMVTCAPNGFLESYPTDTFLRAACWRDGWPCAAQLRSSPSGSFMVLAQWTRDLGVLTLLDPKTLEPHYQFENYPDPPSGYSFLPGSNTMYFGWRDGHIYAVNVDDIGKGMTVVTPKDVEPVSDLVMHQDGAVALNPHTFLIFTGHYGGPNDEFTQYLYRKDVAAQLAAAEEEAIAKAAADKAAGKKPKSKKKNEPTPEPLMDRSGNLLPLGVEPVAELLPDVAVFESSDGKWLMLRGGHRSPQGPRNVYLYDREQGALVWSSGDAFSRGVNFSVDGQYVVICYEGVIEVLSCGSFERTFALYGQKAGAKAAALSKDNKTLLYSDGATLKMMDLATREVLASFDAHQAPIHDMTLSDDGKLAVTVSETEAVVWQLGL